MLSRGRLHFTVQAVPTICNATSLDFGNSTTLVIR
jgi:hypothetical protein